MPPRLPAHVPGEFSRWSREAVKRHGAAESVCEKSATDSHVPCTLSLILFHEQHSKKAVSFQLLVLCSHN